MNYKVIVDKIFNLEIEQLEHINQYVVSFETEKENYICFQSYRSLIAIYNYTTQELLLNYDKWDYSKTTLKHLKIFVNTYTKYKYDSKAQFERDYLNNGIIKYFE